MKIHISGKQKVLAACDEDLLGKTLFDDDLEFTISERFYGGDRVTEEEFKNMLKECSSANLVGNETIRLAKEVYPLGKVVYISDIPHAIIFKVR